MSLLAKTKAVEVNGPQSVAEGAVAAVWTAIDSLSVWEENPRINDPAVASVARSIEVYGFGAPIVAQSGTGFVIAGHTRLKAARSLGMKTVPVRSIDISDTNAKALALADNKLGEFAQWDEASLSAVVSELTRLGCDVADAGFDAAMVASLLKTDFDPGSQDGQGKLDEVEQRPTCIACGQKLAAR